VKVCARRVTTAIAYSKKTTRDAFPRLGLLDALMIRFIGGSLLHGSPFWPPEAKYATPIKLMVRARNH
jgi:hypothetical protein